MNILAIDPGVRATGWAWFRAGELLDCGLIKNAKKATFAQCVQAVRKAVAFPAPADVLVIEVPQVYQQRHWKGDPNSLIEVAIVAGTVCGAANYTDVVFYRPREWKGSCPKDVHNRRVLRTLNEREVVVCDLALKNIPRTLAHNMFDAIGLGRFYTRNKGVDIRQTDDIHWV